MQCVEQYLILFFRFSHYTRFKLDPPSIAWYLNSSQHKKFVEFNC